MATTTTKIIITTKVRRQVFSQLDGVISSILYYSLSQVLRYDDPRFRVCVVPGIILLHIHVKHFIAKSKWFFMSMLLCWRKFLTFSCVSQEHFCACILDHSRYKLQAQNFPGFESNCGWWCSIPANKNKVIADVIFVTSITSSACVNYFNAG